MTDTIQQPSSDQGKIQVNIQVTLPPEFSVECRTDEEALRRLFDALRSLSPQA